MYVVLVTDLELGGTFAYGPYRTLAKATSIAGIMRDPWAVNHYPEDKYAVVAAKLNKYELVWTLPHGALSPPRCERYGVCLEACEPNERCQS